MKAYSDHGCGTPQVITHESKVMLVAETSYPHVLRDLPVHNAHRHPTDCHGTTRVLVLKGKTVLIES
jgi:hypothetical protein